MTKRKARLGWPVWLFLVLLAAAVISALLTLPAMLLPYMASIRYKWICHFVLAPVFFTLFIVAVLCTVHRAHRDPHAKVKKIKGGWVGWIKVLGFCALASLAWAWIFMIIVPAIPSKFFARTKIDIPVTVNHLEGFRLNYDHWTWIYFDKGDHTDRFMWTRSDPLLSKLEHGDCIMLHAREWPLGLYVDSISRSNACRSSSEAESGTTSTHA